MGAGLQSAAQQLQSYGRGSDTLLAHISPDEAHFIDQIQGGRKTNPMTGLPEYSLFGKILKAVVRVGAGIGGFMAGGPLGAAAGSAAATKLTGGSWKQALKAGAFSGIGSGVTQGLTGGGWSLTGAAPTAGAAGAAGTSAVGDGSAAIGGALSPGASAAAAGLPTGATTGLGASLASAGSAGASGVGISPGMLSGLASAAPAAPSGLGAALSQIGGYPGAAAGLGGLSNPLSNDDGGGNSAPFTGNNINLNVKPFARGYQPYTGDATHYGEQPGGWKFFDNVNPSPEYMARGGRVGLAAYADGGRVSQDDQWAQMLPHWPAEAMSQIQGGGSGYPSISPDDALTIGSMGSTLKYPGLKMNNAPRFSDSGEYAGQLKDLVDNENLSPEMMVAKARNLLSWAESRAGDPGFAPYIHQAVTEAQGILRKFSPKSVRPPIDKARGGRVRGYAVSGPTGPQDPGAGLMGLGALHNPGIPSQIETPHMENPMQLRQQAQDMSPMAQRQRIRQAAMLGYVNAKDGGAISGPGTGTSDSIPAMLSDGEHVVDQATVNMFGGGSNHKGQKVLEKMKQRVRARAGVHNPKKPPAFQGRK